MAWLEIHQTVWTSRKTLHLAGLLEIESEVAAAKMIQLWHWCIDNAEDGDLGELPLYVVARAANWTGDPAAFVNAAVEAGYMDRDGDSLKLHDWWDYAGKLIEKRRQDAERKRKERNGKPTSPPVQRTSGGHPGDISGNSTVQNTTVPVGSGRGESEGGSQPSAVAPERTEAEAVLTLLDGLTPQGVPRTDATRTAICKGIQEEAALDPLEVALDYVRWQETLPPKKHHRDVVRGWRNQMRMRHDNSQYERIAEPLNDAAYLASLPRIPLDLLEASKKRVALIEANSDKIARNGRT